MAGIQSIENEENDRRSERNLCSCVKKPEKIQDFNRVWTSDLAITGAMLYQLSYEATDVGSRLINCGFICSHERNHFLQFIYDLFYISLTLISSTGT